MILSRARWTRFETLTAPSQHEARKPSQVEMSWSFLGCLGRSWTYS